MLSGYLYVEMVEGLKYRRWVPGKGRDMSMRPMMVVTGVPQVHELLTGAMPTPRAHRLPPQHLSQPALCATASTLS